MRKPLTPAEAILHRTGPNNITVLFEASGSFDPARAFRGIQMLANGSDRFAALLLRGGFCDAGPIQWDRHVCVLDDPDATAGGLMDLTRCLALPPDRPLWRALLVNPDGIGWSGLALHFDHAIADGTRMARHIVTHVQPSETDRASPNGLPTVSLADLERGMDRRVSAAPTGLCRIPFAALRRTVPDAVSHGDALLRLGRQMLDTLPAFADVPVRRKDHATLARIEALNSGGRLGNHATMVGVDLSRPSGAGDAMLFRPSRAPMVERLRMGAARLIPAPVLRRIVQAEFSRPGIVQTIVPLTRRPLPLFGLPLRAVYPAAPALGRPLLAISAIRFGDGFDASITAHGPDGAAVPDLSMGVARAMVEAVQ